MARKKSHLSVVARNKRRPKPQPPTMEELREAVESIVAQDPELDALRRYIRRCVREVFRRLARREHRRQVFSPGEIASLEAEDERELKVATEQALAECRTRYDAMTDRERAEAAQNHGINDDDCRKHGEPLYSGWCKACAAEAITRAKDEVSAEWKHLRDCDGEEYCRLRDVLDETRKERDSTAEQFLSLVERLNADITELRQRAEAAESALRAIQEIADEDLRRGDHPLQTGLFQIEATARAALASRHPA